MACLKVDLSDDFSFIYKGSMHIILIITIKQKHHFYASIALVTCSFQDTYNMKNHHCNSDIDIDIIDILYQAGVKLA